VPICDGRWCVVFMISLLSFLSFLTTCSARSIRKGHLDAYMDDIIISLLSYPLVLPSNTDHLPVGQTRQARQARVGRLFPAERSREHQPQFFLARPLPHRIPQADLARPKQAHFQSTVRHQPHPVAPITEGLGHGGDKGDRPGPQGQG